MPSQDLVELFRHNTWANGLVFDLAAGLDADLVKREAPGTRDTVLGTLAHLASVEYAYLSLLEDRAPSSFDEIRRWAAHDLTWFPDQMHQIGASFVKLLEASSAEQLARPLNTPWFDFTLTARDGFIQVLTHSAQHRSQVLSWLSAQGIHTPDLDYVVMLREARSIA